MVDSTKVNAFFFIKDGAFNFFCVALISGLTIDYWAGVDSKESINWLKKISFVFFPILSLLFICGHYWVIYFKVGPNNQEVLFSLTMYILMGTVLYSAFVKMYMFSEDFCKKQEEVVC
ncbi:hypothetical protein [Acinetobacter bereziniae]|uniref:hypothetical protein n=1 Tax=Acinetobacter bereziniae TaxID=106648 RepID=UPI001C06AC0F|nr:hypothetical protein [Acinetobacter bereziniae]